MRVAVRTHEAPLIGGAVRNVVAVFLDIVERDPLSLRVRAPLDEPFHDMAWVRGICDPRRGRSSVLAHHIVGAGGAPVALSRGGIDPMFNQGELAFDPRLIARDLEGDTVLGALIDLADPGASRVRQQRRDEILAGEGDGIAAIVTRHAEARVQGKARDVDGEADAEQAIAAATGIADRELQRELTRDRQVEWKDQRAAAQVLVGGKCTRWIAGSSTPAWQAELGERNRG